jgi:hypothetical protein
VKVIGHDACDRGSKELYDATPSEQVSSNQLAPYRGQYSNNGFALRHVRIEGVLQ